MGLSRARTAHRDEGGAIAVMAAVLVMALLASTALAVDVGRTAYVSRDQQGATDRAVLDGVRLLHQAILDGQTAQTLVDQVFAVATESMEMRNPAPGGTERRSIYRVDLGRVGGGGFDEVCREYYLDVGDEIPEDEDTSEQVSCEGDVAGLNVDAVRLWTHSEVAYVLPLGEQRSAELRKMAVATADAIGSISAATTTAALEGGVINELLSGLVGIGQDEDDDGQPLDLGLVGHEGIADVTITLGDLVRSDRLGVGTVQELLTADIHVADFLHATADVLHAGDGEDASSAEITLAAALRELGDAALTAGLGPIRLDYDPEVGGDEDNGIVHFATGDGRGADIGLGALDLAVAALQLANRNEAVRLELGAFGDTLVDLTLIQPPVTAIGHAGKIDGRWRTAAPSAQMRLTLDLPVGPSDGAVNGGSIDQRVERYEDMLAPFRSQTSTHCQERKKILEELDKELEEIEEYFADTGLLTSVVMGLIGGLASVLGGLLGALDCTFLGGYQPTASDVDDAIEEYRKILVALGEEALPQISGDPTLTITLGEGEVRLAEISCSDPGSSLLNARTSAVGIEMPETTLLEISDAVLGLTLARITMGIDREIASAEDQEERVYAPYPSDAARFSSGEELGLAELAEDLMPRAQVIDDRLDSDDLMRYVLWAIAPVLDELDDELTGLFDLLGVDLGVVEGRVLEVQCTGRRLVE